MGGAISTGGNHSPAKTTNPVDFERKTKQRKIPLSYKR